MYVAVAYTSSCSIIDAAPVLTLMLLTLIHVLHATLCDMLFYVHQLTSSRVVVLCDDYV